MSQIVVDIKAGSVTVDDYIRLHAATDFIIRGVAQESMALSISTHQGICLFRITNFTRGDDELSARVTLESDGLVAAFRHVPPLGSRKFILSIHSRNASFSILFSEELMIWNDIAHSTDMGDYALKSEIPDVSGFVTADYLNAYVLKRELPDFDIYVKTSDLSGYALKSELPEINLSGYALKSELFSRKYEDLTGAPDLTVYVKSSELSKYALKSELPESVDLSRYLLKAEAFSGRYSDLAGVPDLSQYALKSELPDGVDLSLYQLKADAFGGSYSDLTGKPDLTVYAKNADLSRYALKSEIPASADLSLYQLKADAFSRKYEDLTGAPDLSVYVKKSELFNTPVTLSDNLNAVIPPNGKVTPFLQHDTTTGLYELRVRLPGGSTASVSQSAPDMSLYLTVASAAETYAAKGHVHTGVYAPLENGKIPSAYLPEGSGGGGAATDISTDVLDTLYAKKDHVHEKYLHATEAAVLYAGINHTHAGQFLEQNTADNRYSLKGHVHDDRYCTMNESDQRYARASHNHDGKYAPLSGGKIPMSCLDIRQVIAVVAENSGLNGLSGTMGDLAYVYSDRALYIYDGTSWLNIGNFGNSSFTMTWNDIQNKPSSFPTEAHSHADYAKRDHSHEEYALTGHVHEGVYAAYNHIHSNYLTEAKADNTYSVKEHTHSQYLTRQEAGTLRNSSEHVVATIAERDELSGLQSGDRAFVVDASGDSSVESGSAEYIWSGESWIKFSTSHSGSSSASGSAGTSISRYVVNRPTGDDAYHLKVEYSESADFSTTSVLVDTLGQSEDREKVLVWNAVVDGESVVRNFIIFPEGGLNTAFEGAPVVIDCSGILDGKNYFLRYKWYTAETNGEWNGAAFPACGGGNTGRSESGGSSSAGSETVMNVWIGTSAEYEAIEEPDPQTFYSIEE